MAVTEKAGGTQLTVINTEHTLTTITDAGVFQLLVDLEPMVDGDELELRIDIEVRTGGTPRTAFNATYAHEQGVDSQISFSVPIPTVASADWIATLKQTAGSVRTFTWAVYEYGNA